MDPRISMISILISIVNAAWVLAARLIRFVSHGTEFLRNRQAADGLAMDITIHEHADNSKIGPHDPRLHLRYVGESKSASSGSRIVPKMGYLDQLKACEPVGPVRLPGVPFSWDWPTLDIQMVNNSVQTVSLSRADFLVKSSAIDLEPVPMFVDFGHHNALSMYIQNEGWGDILNGSLQFNLAPYTDHIKDRLPAVLDFDLPFIHKLSLPNFSEVINVDLSSAFEQEGVDVIKIKSHNLYDPNVRTFRAGNHYRYVNSKGGYSDMSLEDYALHAPPEFGEFKTGGAVIYGKLIYDWQVSKDECKESCVYFYNILWLYEERGSGTGMYPSERYDVALRAMGENYQVTMPLHQVLKPGEADRFTIRVSVPCSSEHTLKVRFTFNGNRTINGEQIRMSVFVPRSDSPSAKGAGTEIQT